ncbi:nibrin [Trichonephila clavipes]|nr:nibrin [Trichonephila clavipes]
MVGWLDSWFESVVSSIANLHVVILYPYNSTTPKSAGFGLEGLELSPYSPHSEELDGLSVWAGISKGGCTNCHVIRNGNLVAQKNSSEIRPSSPCKQCRRMPSIRGYHPYELVSILTGLESNRACVGYTWPTNCSPSTLCHLSTGTSEGIVLDE